MHQFELAVRDGAASWCSCTCGWVSEHMAEDDVTNAWAAHIAASTLSEASSRATGP